MLVVGCAVYVIGVVGVNGVVANYVGIGCVVVAVVRGCVARVAVYVDIVADCGCFVADDVCDAVIQFIIVPVSCCYEFVVAVVVVVSVS